MYKFKAYGHENITARHKTTLEFIKDEDLSLKGDCIVGVRADFDLKGIKKFINNLKDNQVAIIIKTIPVNKNQKTILEKIKADKAAFGLNKNVVNILKDKKSRVAVSIESR